MDFVTDPNLERSILSISNATSGPDSGSASGSSPAGTDGPMDIGSFASPDIEKKVLSLHNAQMQRDADSKTLGGDVDAPFTTFASNALNTALLNAPMAAQAGLDYWRGKSNVNDFQGSTYKDYLDNRNAIEEARSRQNPIASAVGTGTGIVGPIAATIMSGGAAAPAAATSLGKLAVKGAATGALMGGTSEALRTNELGKTLGGATFGAAGGAILSPGAELLGRAVNKALGNKINATLAPEAQAALNEAYPGGVPDSVMATALQKGGDVGSANHAILTDLGISPTRGQATGNFKVQQVEQAMAKAGDAYGPKANSIATEAFANQDAQIAAAKGNVVPTGLDPRDAAQQIMDGVRQAHADSKAGYKALYDDAFSRPGAFEGSLFSDMGTRIGDQLANRSFGAGGPILIEPTVTPRANMVLSRLNDGTLIRAAEDGTVPLANVDGTRKIITQAIGDSWQNPSDKRALKGILGQFDNHLENAAGYGLYSGDPQALASLSAARQAYGQHASTFGRIGPGDTAGSLVQEIVNPNVPMSVDSLASKLFGKNSVQSNSATVNAADRLNTILGDTAPWKQAVWEQTVNGTQGAANGQPQNLATRIRALYDSDIGQRFSATERAKMLTLAKGMETLAPATLRGTSASARPDTAYGLGSLLADTANGAAKHTSIGAILGFSHGGPMGAVVGGLGQAALHKGSQAVTNWQGGRRAAALFGGIPDYVARTPGYAAPYVGGATGGLLGDDVAYRGLL